MIERRRAMRPCDYCGEIVDVGPHWGSEPVSCGKPECDRCVRYIRECERAQAKYEAEQDDYGRYR